MIDLLKTKEWGKVYHDNTDQKKSGVTMLISEEVDLKINAVQSNIKTVHFFDRCSSCGVQSILSTSMFPSKI